MPSSRGRRAQEQVGAASPCSHVSESCLDQARRAGWDEAKQAPPGSGQQGEGETHLRGRLTHARSYQRHASPRKKHPMQQRACAAPGMQHLLQDYCKTRPACNPSSSCLAPALTVPGWDLGCLLQHQGTQEAPVSPPDPRTHAHPWFNLHSSAHGARWEAGGCWVPQPDVQSPAVRHAAGRAARRGLAAASPSPPFARRLPPTCLQLPARGCLGQTSQQTAACSPA